MITKPPDDFVPGDDVCLSCTGIVYFNKEMKKRGETPLCIGVKSTLKRKIPLDKLDAMDKQNAKTELETYVCIGYSQTSVRMERMGKIPICIQGVQFQISPTKSSSRGNAKHISDGSSRSTNSEAEDASAPAPGGALGSSNPHNPAHQLITGQHESMYASAVGFSTFMQKGMTKQWERMGKTFGQITHQLPQRMYKSGRQLFISSGKTVDRLQRGISKMWNNWK